MLDRHGILEGGLYEVYFIDNYGMRTEVLCSCSMSFGYPTLGDGVIYYYTKKGFSGVKLYVWDSYVSVTVYGILSKKLSFLGSNCAIEG